MSKKEDTRNSMIVQEYIDGVKQTEIARKYGLTRQRIGQLTQPHRAEAEKARKVRIVAFLNENFTMGTSAAARALGAGYAEIKSIRDRIWPNWKEMCVEVRFREKTEVVGECTIWRGNVHKPTGYGRMRFNGKVTYVHQLAFYFHTGMMPSGYMGRSCGNKLCVEPEHLFLYDTN